MRWKSVTFRLLVIYTKETCQADIYMLSSQHLQSVDIYRYGKSFLRKFRSFLVRNMAVICQAHHYVV